MSLGAYAAGLPALLRQVSEPEMCRSAPPLPLAQAGVHFAVWVPQVIPEEGNTL